MPDRNEDEIGKASRREQLAHLPGKIPRPENATKNILPLALAIDERADASVLHRHKGREFLQTFRDALNRVRGLIRVEKPIATGAAAGSPKCAEDRRDVDAHADTVAKHADVR